MSGDENSWRTSGFRQSVVSKIDEAILISGMPTMKKGMEMENHVYQKAKSREEYLGFVAKLILHVREMNSKKGAGMSSSSGQSLPDPINALQTLARQGTGNQMMGMAQVPQQAANPNMMQAMNPRPVLQQKLQPGPQVQGPMMGQMGGGMGAGMAGGAPGGMAGMVAPPQMGGPMGSPQMPTAQHMAQRKGEGMMMGGQATQGFVGPRGVATAQYLRQSPTPPNASPVAIQGSQMVPSPALVPSPSNPPLGPGMQGSIRSIGMASSPSSCLNTPVGAQAVPTPSPCGLQEDTAYREKIRQLSKYIEPLRRMIARVGNDDLEKLSKMKTLLDILTNPSKRMPLETLLKCEAVLEKLDLKRGEAGGQAVREQHPLIEALRNHLQSPVINHTLQRTFGPCMEALFGSDIKMLPPPLKKKKVEDLTDDIPEVLQGEIARLDQRFKVSLDPTQGSGCRSVQLVCWLDDRHLPCVPPVLLTVPEDYPATPPRCHLASHEHSATQFLLNVQAALESRVAKLPAKFTVSQLLDTWEMSVRQACAPPSPHTSPSTTTVLMGL